MCSYLLKIRKVVKMDKSKGMKNMDRLFLDLGKQGKPDAKR